MKVNSRAGSIRRERANERLPPITSRKKAYSDMIKSRKKIPANERAKDTRPSLVCKISEIIFNTLTLLSSQ